MKEQVKIQITQEPAVLHAYIPVLNKKDNRLVSSQLLKRTDKLMLKQYKLRFYNFRLIIFLLAISLIGVTLVGTAASDLRSKQFAELILGLICHADSFLCWITHWIMNFQWIMYGFNIIMLIVVRIAGDSANGAARWIGIGSFRFQPTELSKIILIVFFAKFFMDHEETLNTLKTLALSGVLLAVPLFLILEQPDLKNTITVVVIFCIMIYIAV